MKSIMLDGLRWLGGTRHALTEWLGGTREMVGGD